MTEQARDQRNLYMRNYRKANREKIKEIQSKYWENKVLGKEEEFKNN